MTCQDRFIARSEKSDGQHRCWSHTHDKSRRFHPQTFLTRADRIIESIRETTVLLLQFFSTTITHAIYSSRANQRFARNATSTAPPTSENHHALFPTVFAYSATTTLVHDADARSVGEDRVAVYFPPCHHVYRVSVFGCRAAVASPASGCRVGVGVYLFSGRGAGDDTAESEGDGWAGAGGEVGARGGGDYGWSYGAGTVFG